MPLDRQHITAASRVMLPAYVVFFAALGFNYMTAEQVALNNPALAFANDLMPLPVWGAVFLVCACLMGVALLLKQRFLYRFALRFCAVSMVFWAVVIAWASWVGDATPLAAAWSAFVATACYATDRSLAAREV